MAFTDWFLSNKPRRQAVVVIGAPVSREHWWEHHLAAVVAAAIGVGFVVLTVTFLTTIIRPVHRALGQPFTIRGMTYQVERVSASGGKVVVTMHVTYPDPNDCLGVASFTLDDGGHEYSEHQLIQVFNPVTGRFVPVSMPVSGCFAVRDVIRGGTIVPASVYASLGVQPITHQQLSAIMSANEPPQVGDHAWSFWWRPLDPPLGGREWTITYHAAASGAMSLIVQSAGGFHALGLDEYAVVRLTPR